MKRFRKNKTGFTLIEMVLVIAIIVILAAVLVMAIGGYIARARNAASSLNDHNESVKAAATAIYDDAHI
ncbi:MAG: type II secretion system protein [Clostridiales bacterium]|nr:type II secretion system protein [Clostridiales bacterium]